MIPRLEGLHVQIHSGVDNARYFASTPVKTVVFDSAEPQGATIELLPDHNALEKNYAQLADFRPAVEPIGFHFMAEAVMRGRCFLFKEECLLDRQGLIPSYVRHGIDTGQYNDAEHNPARALRLIEHAVAIIAADAYLVYGHWLIDILPRAWLFNELFGEAIHDIRFVLPSNTPDYAFGLLNVLFGVKRDEVVFFDPASEEIQLKRAVIPSLLHADHAFHPSMNYFISFVLSKATDIAGPIVRSKNSELIYVSRHRFRARTTSYGRHISNEDEVLNLVKSFGFIVVCPEEFSFLEQVRIFAGARVIVGESGSGLHNSMFSDFGTVVLCIRPVNQVQATLAALRRQTVMFLCPDDEYQEGRETVFALDISRLERAILRCLDISNANRSP